MTPQGRFVFGWFVVIILIVAFIVGICGLMNIREKKQRCICGLMSFTALMSLILVSNLL